MIRPFAVVRVMLGGLAALVLILAGVVVATPNPPDVAPLPPGSTVIAPTRIAPPR
ncbi:hypothetical protein H0264_06435 [Nocardia huaxiensis]|uniref:Uncharacterized protein n=1 Tax=Nocardia huaxiensis TaxID=2755382 RepID=A0A7D6VG81_9NOCA|nr:hypothetical protein [Nocardia huaxiensis]QLY31935.1 hypothetical protein H0264_06435 [Nocardia huaxiensis]